MLILVKNVFSSHEAIKTTADLLSKGFSDDKVQNVISETLKKSSSEILSDK